MDALDQQRALIEEAMADVKLVVCPLCNGLGKLPRGLFIECPHCEGRGERVEVRQDA